MSLTPPWKHRQLSHLASAALSLHVFPWEASPARSQSTTSRRLTPSPLAKPTFGVSGERPFPCWILLLLQSQLPGPGAHEEGPSHKPRPPVCCWLQRPRPPHCTNFFHLPPGSTSLLGLSSGSLGLKSVAH